MSSTPIAPTVNLDEPLLIDQLNEKNEDQSTQIKKAPVKNGAKLNSKHKPTLQDFPPLGNSSSSVPHKPVAWGPNVKPSIVSKTPTPSPSPNFTSGSTSVANSTFSSATSSSSGAVPMRSKKIQETFSLDLQAQLSISKPEFSRIVLSVKQANGVSVESTLSKNSRTFLISGAPEKVHAARRELVKRLTKPITTTFTVPSRTRAAIIGSGGKKIKEITEKAGGDVRIDLANTVNEDSYDEDLDDSFIDVSIHGDFDSVTAAKKEILDLVNEYTKNATLTVQITEKLGPFVNLNDVSGLAKDLKINKYDETIVVSGLRDDAKIAKVLITNYLNSLNAKIVQKKIAIPKKFQFLINKDEIKEKFSVLVTFNTDSEDVTFTGVSDSIDKAVQFSRENSQTFVVETLDISKAHGKNLAHAKNVALYFYKYDSVLQPIRDAHKNVNIFLPTPADILEAATVDIRMNVKMEFKEEIVAARKDIIGLVNELKPSYFLSIADLDYELYHKDVKHILSGAAKKVSFVQLGDYYTGNDTILLIAHVDADDFSPSDEEIQGELTRISTELLEPLRKKQANLSTEVLSISDELQDSLLATASTVTRRLILEDVNQHGGHVQFKLHLPTAGKLVIRGDEKAVKVVAKDLEKIMANPSKKEKIVIEVPTKVVSRLIGNKGSNLNSIRDSYDCQIDINQDNNNKSNSAATTEVIIIGMLFNIDHCKQHILAEAKKWSDIITKELVVPNKYHRSLIGPRGIYAKRLQEKYNVNINFPENGEIITIRGPSRGCNKAFEELSDLLDFEIENSHKIIKKIPTKYVSNIIGKNGETIKDIVDEFGVELNFLQSTTEAKENGVEEVELEIIGNKKSIKDCSEDLDKMIAKIDDFVAETLDVEPKYRKFIVGPNGSVLKEILRKSGGEDLRGPKVINVPNSTSEDSEVKIQGPKNVVNKIVKEIKKIMEDVNNSTTKTLDIPHERYGALIGPGAITRTELENTFNVVIKVPRRDDTDSKVTIFGLPKNIEECEKKIFTEIIGDNYDLEIQVPAKYQDFVSEHGAFIQLLRTEYFINVRHGNSSTKVSQAVKKSYPIPAEEVRGTEGKFKTTLKEDVVIDENDTDFIPWRLKYEPVDLSDILGEEHADDKKADKNEILAQVQEMINKRIEEAPKATWSGYIWCSNPRDFPKILGFGGSNIKKIRKSSGAIISVPRRNDKINDVIYVRGTKESVENAISSISKQLK
ncbi:Scp160p SCDLUD_003593 [Saccharomycodes ludwigii]|uniref:Scp160p n=1 Tax=Saccharomycodes ludwigii TaxID=36035 RepID=UPI001E87CC0C|nr:hypothetical protein SCDLUD_003593 [Saccharomycodes ludwigii]KAH3900601.1 hypothetical protein SCDLUD_003593 [Saccharomycodes ludwigii]